MRVPEISASWPETIPAMAYGNLRGGINTLPYNLLSHVSPVQAECLYRKSWNYTRNPLPIKFLHWCWYLSYCLQEQGAKIRAPFEELLAIQYEYHVISTLDHNLETGVPTYYWERL